MTLPLPSTALIDAVFLRSTFFTIDMNQTAICWLSALIGRDNFTFVNLRRVGSWWTQRLLPPSSRCSTAVSMPRPSKLFHHPALRLSTERWNMIETAGSAIAVNVHLLSSVVSSSVPVPWRFPQAPTAGAGFGCEQAPEAGEEPAGEQVE